MSGIQMSDVSLWSVLSDKAVDNAARFCRKGEQAGHRMVINKLQTLSDEEMGFNLEKRSISNIKEADKLV